MTSPNQSFLRFSLEESIWFPHGHGVVDLYSLSIEPLVEITEENHYVNIRGYLEVTGEYGGEGGLEVEEEEELPAAGNVSQIYVQKVDYREEDGLFQFSHHFPVDISVPTRRVEDRELVEVEISSFDYHMPENTCIKLIADLLITGVYDVIPSEQSQPFMPEFQTSYGRLHSAEADSAEAEGAGEEVFESFEDSTLSGPPREESAAIKEIPPFVPFANQQPEQEMPVFQTSYGRLHQAEAGNAGEEAEETEEAFESFEASAVSELPREESAAIKDIPPFVPFANQLPVFSPFTIPSLPPDYGKDDRKPVVQSYDEAAGNEKEMSESSYQEIPLSTFESSVETAPHAALDKEAVSPRAKEEYTVMDGESTSIVPERLNEAGPESTIHAAYQESPIQASANPESFESMPVPAEEPRTETALEQERMMIHTNAQQSVDSTDGQGNNNKSVSLMDYFSAKEAAPAAKMKVCIVQAGETLSEIANRYEVAKHELLLSNHLNDESDVQEGHVLYIPFSMAYK